jgi:AcrR family transcriptional regulator
VFERCGYAGATTDRIAVRAGVSVGSLYQYFPDKDALLLHLARRHMDEGLALVRQGVAAFGALDVADPTVLRPALRSLVAALWAHHRTRPRLQRMLLEQVPVPPDTMTWLTAREDELVALLAGLLLRLPAPPPPNPGLTAWALLHLVQALLHDFVVHRPAGVSEDDLLDELTRLLLHVLGAEA